MTEHPGGRQPAGANERTKKMHTITRAEYLQLVGLMTLAKKHYAAVDELQDHMYELLGIDNSGDDRSGGILDVIYGLGSDRDAAKSIDSALKAHAITVLEEPS